MKRIALFVYNSHPVHYNGIYGLGSGNLMVDFNACLLGLICISALLVSFAGYSYFINQRVSPGDPAHKDYDVYSLFLVPITWPLFLIFGALFAVLRALFFGAALLLFTVAAVVIRVPFFWPLLEPLVKKIGNTLLKVNTALLQLFTRDR